MEIVKENKRDVLQKADKKAIYDPNKQYTWQPDAVFTLNGEAFGALLNLCRGILSTREAQTILLADRANDHIEELFKKSVENGIAVEANIPK